MPKMMKHLLLALFAGGIGLLAIQLIPYGRNHSNPPVIREPLWDSPATRDLAKRACFDCHSHETVWRWYSRLAPVSWLIRYDVDEGRSELNFSDWKGGARKGERPSKIGEEIAEGGMPPLAFRLVHPEARLSKAEKQQLINGLIVTSGRH